MNWKLHRLYKMLRYEKRDARRYGHLSLEFFEVEGTTFEFMGWAYDRVHREVLDRRIVIKDHAGNVVFQNPLHGVKREDTVTYMRDHGSLYSGFYGKMRIVASEELVAYIEYEAQGQTYSTLFFKIEPNCHNCPAPQVEWVFPAPLIEDCDAEGSVPPFEEDCRADFETVDVIVPVYNGMRFLPKLFDSISKTDVPYRLVIVDDASPDVRVREYLDRFAADHSEVTLLRNDVNLGFLKSANRGLSNASGDAVIVNTDVELPSGWLERMIRPVLEHSDIASVTPFTNSGTICSFPRFCEDNHLQAGLDVEEMDRYFRDLPMELFEVPTGVGFCMTMSRAALDDIGLFDEENFGRGYAEENDWCQRAIAAGYKNVHISNLFVYHNHGGSFQSDEKKELVRDHLEALERKHPRYGRDVQDYIKQDPAKNVRKRVERALIAASDTKSVIILDHRWGGGATSYAKKKREELIQNGCRVTVIQYDEGLNLFLAVSQLDEMEHRFSAQDLDAALRTVGRIDEILVNEIVSFPNVSQLLQFLPIVASRHGAELIFPVHDFFELCQSYNLINNRKEFCGLPGHGICSKCFCQIRKNEFVGTGITEYRLMWGEFLRKCSRVVCFSESSRMLLEKVYACLDNIEVRPHEVEPLKRVTRKARMKENLTIGVLGMISHVKGRDVIKALLDYIELDGLDVDVVIMGVSDGVYPEMEKIETGVYEREEIPEIALREGIDVFFIPSIWPETFSYTTAEIMSMGYPIAVFDLGAPPERVAEYDRGIVIPATASPAEIIAALQELAYETVHIDRLPVKKEEGYLLVSASLLEDDMVRTSRVALLEQGFMPEVLTVDAALERQFRSDRPVAVVSELVEDCDRESVLSFLDSNEVERRRLEPK